MTEHDGILELLPGYILGSLDEAEAIVVAEHLSECAGCQAELQAYQAVVDELALTAPLAAPSPDLQQRLLARIEGLAAVVLDDSGIPRQRPSPLSSFWQRAGLVWGLVSLLLVVGLGISTLILWQQVKQLPSPTPIDRMQNVPLIGTNAAPQASGYILISVDGDRGALVVDDLPPLDANSQYQLWLIRDEERSSGAVFSVDEAGYGLTWITASDSLFSYTDFGISIEPAGGSPVPTGDKVMGGTLK